jgi:branched-subunit amino acid aminotransferase/4-amino-4-deoxychorismate lyase
MGVAVVLSAFRGGAFAAPDEVTIVVQSHALRYGANACEGIRPFGGADAEDPPVFRTDRHRARLPHSARFYGLEPPCSVEELRTIAASRPAGHEVRANACPRPILSRSSSDGEVRCGGLAGSVVSAKGRPA